MSYGKKGRNQLGYYYIPWPCAVFESNSLAALSPYGIKLLVDLAGQYNRRNNGDLCAAWKVMRPKGWRSEDTLNKAKKELLSTGFIFETKKGYRPNTCSLYAISWWSLDPSPKHDVGAGGFRKGAYLAATREERLSAMKRPQKKNTALNTAVGVVVAQ